MKNLPLIIISIAILITGSFSCKKLKTSEAEKEREQWFESFNDSVKYYDNRNKELSDQLNHVNAQINDLLSNFEYINNPKEVAGYYILNGWSKKVPLTHTGIYARISEREELELIATLSSSTFNRIAVGEGGELYYSETRPHDQAFNYRHKGYNTVYFSGGKADTIAEYISTHRADKINLEFLDGNKKREFLLPSDEKEMIYKTWEFFSVKNEASQLQKELWMNARKIETFNKMMVSK